MIKHNKAIAFFIIMALAAMFCVGCGQDNTAKPQSSENNGENPADVEDNFDNDSNETGEKTTSEIAQFILDNIKFEDQMDSIGMNLFLGLYNLEGQSVVEATVYESTGATAEEFAVIKVDSDEDMTQVKAAIESRIESQKTSFENYVPGELDKLSEPVIMEENRTIIFIVCNDNKNAKTLLEDMDK